MNKGRIIPALVLGGLQDVHFDFSDLHHADDFNTGSSVNLPQRIGDLLVIQGEAGSELVGADAFGGIAEDFVSTGHGYFLSI